MKKHVLPGIVLGASVFVAVTASAHVSISSGPAFTETSMEVNFQIAHGCEPTDGGAMTDTVKLVIDIPDGVTSVRPTPNAFGNFTVTGNPVTQVTYEKSGPALASDSAFYKFTIRLKPPNQPFTKVYFPAHQYCTGFVNPTEWTKTPTNNVGDDVAPELAILPPRKPGWNKYTVPGALTDLKIFDDAQIVWKGNAAYSSNKDTTAQIAAEPNATPLTALAASDEIWVRY